MRPHMRTPAGRVFAVALVVCACASITRATPQQISGTGRIAGAVVSATTPAQPVRGAVVTLNGAGANGRSVLTDDQGRFAFAGLPAGRFTITASKPAWLTNAYGAKAPGRPGTAVVLAADQAIADLTVVLPHGAAIAGTLRDVNGAPAPMMPITVVRVDVPVTPENVPPRDAVTDDRGAYRVYGLAPGTYLVSSSMRLMSAYSQVAVLSPTEMDSAFREQQARAGGTPPPTPAAAPRPALRSYAPTYFPGTAVAAEATRITLATGEDREGVDFGLVMVPVATVSGRVVSAGGPLPEISVSLVAEATSPPGLPGVQPAPNVRTGVNGDDTFKLSNVAPGHYTLAARSSNMQTTILSSGAIQSSRSVDPASVSQLWATMEIDVRGDDVTGLTLQLQPALSLGGRVVFNGTTPPPQNLAAVRVSLNSDLASTPALGSMVQMGLIRPSDSMSVSASARPDGSFQLVGVVPGRFHLSARAPGAGWWLQSATVGSREVLDSGLDLSASASDAVLTFSDRHTEISGTLRTAAGAPAPDLVVVAFPADPALWPVSRRLQSARPASDGRFAFADLPPGDYILAALADDEGWQMPSTLQQLAASGAKVALADGAKIVQDLKIDR